VTAASPKVKMNNLGECALTSLIRKTAIAEIDKRLEYKLYGELETSTTVTQYTFPAANPTAWQPLTELIKGPARGVLLDTPPSPTESSMTVAAEGVYNFNVDLQVANPAGGGTRGMQLSTFVNGVQSGTIVDFNMSNFDIGSVTFTGLSQLISEYATLDFRFRKVDGSSFTMDIRRSSITVWGSFLKEKINPGLFPELKGDIF